MIELVESSTQEIVPAAIAASCAQFGTADLSATARGRAWLITQYLGHISSGVLELPTALPENATYWTGQLEVCPETEREHVQAFVRFASVKSRRQVIATTGPCHLVRVTAGTDRQVIAYCQKDRTRKAGTTFVEFGVPPRQGQRTDIKEFVVEVRAGKRKRALVESHTGIIARYRHFYADIRNLYPPKRDGVKTILLVGGTGTGKSHFAREIAGDPENLWVKPKGRNAWFDGYDGHEFALLDDFKGNVPLLLLLELLDPWSVRVEVKGSFVWFNPTTIIITSNYHPRDWYDYDGRAESRAALYRRLSVVYEFTGFRAFNRHDTAWSSERDVGSIPYLYS